MVRLESYGAAQPKGAASKFESGIDGETRGEPDSSRGSSEAAACPIEDTAAASGSGGTCIFEAEFGRHQRFRAGASGAPTGNPVDTDTQQAELSTSSSEDSA